MAELCGLLAFSAIRNDDKVGLTLFHGDIEQYIPARKGQKHSLRVVREVLAHGTEATPARAPRRHWIPWRRRRRRGWLRSGRHATNIARAMEFLMSVMARKAVCFVVSDFFDDGFLQAMQAANRKHDVIAVLITDPRELELPNVGLIHLADPETGHIAAYDTASARFRQHHAQASQDRVARLEHTFRARDIDFIHIDTTGSIVDPLVKFFQMRSGRMRR